LLIVIFLYLCDMKMKLPYESTSRAIKGYSESAIAKGETNDCVVRAFASSFELSYDESHRFVAEKFKRQNRRGTFGTVFKMMGLVDSNVEINGKKIKLVGNKTNSYLKGSLSYPVKVKGETKMRQMTVGRFIKNNPKGTFFVLVTRHAFTIKDGVVIGNWDDAEKTKRPMRCAFEIK
jgi:hypothetical protein